MNIACVLNVHGDTELVLDTIDALRRWVTNDILVVVDGAKWDSWGKDVVLPAYKMCGSPQKHSRSPCRNVALGLKHAWELWGEKVDWICYTEYDVLFTSDRFVKNLETAEKNDIWMLGNDGRVEHFSIPLLESLAGPMKTSYYLLGCCQFFHKKFLLKLDEMKFYDKFLHMLSGFTSQIPGYTGYDISEHIYPSLARHLGGNIGVFASWDGSKWHGSYEIFPMRWKPELNPETENFTNASIMHPLKKFTHPIRVTHRERRRNENDRRTSG